MSRKPYVREIPATTWYFSRKRDLLHMAQELTCIFIGVYALVLVWGLKALADGPEAWQAFLLGLGSPLSMVFHWALFPVTLFHSVSWFGVTHKAMPVQIGDEFLPGGVIVGGHYVAWIAVSLFTLFFAGAF